CRRGPPRAIRPRLRRREELKRVVEPSDDQAVAFEPSNRHPFVGFGASRHFLGAGARSPGALHARSSRREIAPNPSLRGRLLIKGALTTRRKSKVSAPGVKVLDSDSGACGR